MKEKLDALNKALRQAEAASYAVHDQTDDYALSDSERKLIVLIDDSIYQAQRRLTRLQKSLGLN